MKKGVLKYFALVCLTISFVSFNGNTTSVNAETKAASSQTYKDAYSAYEKAVDAKNKINNAITELKNVVAAFPEDEINKEGFTEDSTLVTEWKEKYDAAYANLIEARDTYYPLILDYQTKNDVYNASGDAPEENIKDVYSPKDLNTKIDAITVELKETVDVNTSLALEYEKLYKAYADLEKANKEYNDGLSIGNEYDPNNNFELVWKPIINSHYDLDYTSLGYTEEQLKNMNTKEEFNQFVLTYETKGKDALDNSIAYGDYLIGVSNKWSEAKKAYNTALAEFNAATGSNVSIKFFGDYLKIYAEGMQEGVKMTYDFNLKNLKQLEGWYEEDTGSVYEHIERLAQAYRYAGIARGEGVTPLNIDEPSFEKKEVNLEVIDIELLTVYKLSQPKDSTTTTPDPDPEDKTKEDVKKDKGTAEREETVPQTGNNILYIVSIMMISLGSLLYAKKELNYKITNQKRLRMFKSFCIISK